ncbi:MAG: hypothetical protein O3C63_09560, partial [Cyanobacteria bacterium]|nr:hypothetical protein [Cyanobacteriota bacterium]
ANGYAMGVDNSDDDKFKISYSGTATPSLGTGDVFTIDDTGNIGIGIADPTRRLHISDVMKIEPRSSAPSTPTLGDIYIDSDSKEFCFYDGSSWVGLKAAGACS